jgi:flagellar basal-body rod protein FlgB
MGLLDAVERLHVGLDYHLARHNLLASNLAHLDTPGYKPVDLQRPASSFHAQMQVAMAETDPRHLGAGTGATHETAASWKTVEDATATPGLDGNAVSVDREAAKIAANQVRYSALASLVSGELAGLSWAANDGRGT